MSIVILASQNKGKIREMNAILQKYDMEAISRDDAGLPRDDVEETGTTFEENSLIKAEAIREMILSDPALAQYKDCPIIADDTGLMVDALDGAPGVYSARYAGENCTYEDNYMKLLDALKGVEKDERTAYFVTVITVLYPDGSKLVARGECHGFITEEPVGDEGFGYDPVFQPVGYEETFAQLGVDVKNDISHRANALRELERMLGA